MKMPQRKTHKSMSGDELLKKVADQTYGKAEPNMLSALEKDEC